MDGENGAPGQPGVNLWKVEGKAVDALLVPPVISGGPEGGGAQKIITTEGDFLKLTCAAAGVPKPMISWNRLDGNAIPEGTWRSAHKILPERFRERDFLQFYPGKNNKEICTTLSTVKLEPG